VRKGIAVDTVILIILGVVVLALVGYLLYTKFGQITPQGSLNDCRTTVITKYCPQALAGGWFSTQAEWIASYKFGDSSHFPECSSFATELKMSTCANAAGQCGAILIDVCK